PALGYVAPPAEERTGHRRRDRLAYDRIRRETVRTGGGARRHRAPPSGAEPPLSIRGQPRDGRGRHASGGRAAGRGGGLSQPGMGARRDLGGGPGRSRPPVRRRMARPVDRSGGLRGPEPDAAAATGGGGGGPRVG